PSHQRLHSAHRSDRAAGRSVRWIHPRNRRRRHGAGAHLRLLKRPRLSGVREGTRSAADNTDAACPPHTRFRLSGCAEEDTGFRSVIVCPNSSSCGGIEGVIRAYWGGDATAVLRTGRISTLHPSQGRARAPCGAPDRMRDTKKLRLSERFRAPCGAPKRSELLRRIRCLYSLK